MSSFAAPADPRAAPDWRLDAETVWLPTADEMARLDASAVERGATTERTLIECAGREIARWVQRRWPEGPVLAVAGSGHNGADALVALRTLAAWGREVRAFRAGSTRPQPEVLRAWDVPLEEPTGLEAAAAAGAVVLDGLLGTGLAGPPREDAAALIERVNGLGVPVVAVDGPSGADFTTGSVPGACIRARLTVSLGWPKLGLLRAPARDRCGDLVAVDIGFPPFDPAPGARAITARWVRGLLPVRRPDAHKGDAGYLTLVAGGAGMAGASVLAARSALRAGAGIVRVVGDPENRSIVQSSVAGALFFPWNDEAAVAGSVEWADAVAVGPGLGRGEERRALVRSVLALRGSRPCLLDADGLNAWEGRVDELADLLGEGDLVTPHPGEAARLLDMRIEDIVADPPAAARAAAERLGCVVLLKGAPTMVAARMGPLRVARSGGGALAAGGTGDVLTGAAAAFLAAGLDAADAATCGLLLTGIAAAEAPEPVGHLAEDLPGRIPDVRRRVLALAPAHGGTTLFASFTSSARAESGP